jgi:SAM-dependent methyltransferase
MLTQETGGAYYAGRLTQIADIFGGAEASLTEGGLDIDGRFFSVLDDVIIALDESRLPDSVHARLTRPLERSPAEHSPAGRPFREAVQYGFGAEWHAHPCVLREHEDEFRAYFDLVDLDGLRGTRVADLGCGNGRWASFVEPRCGEVVLVDYSEAIFLARQNLRHAENAIFVMADILDLPFRNGAFDFAYCLGVLHHLPVDGLATLRALKPLAPRHLVYVYYALDDRPTYFRWLLGGVTRARGQLAKIRRPAARWIISWLLTLLVYMPLAMLGRLLRPFGAYHWLPLAEVYAGKTVARMRQDAYDRFFTSIEQRFSREQILELEDTFSSVTISNHPPYWHFLCE